MTRRIAIAALALLAGGAHADEFETVRLDDAGDAVLRRTDPGNDGPVGPDAVLPDILEVRVGSWAPFNACANPYDGQPVNPDIAHLFRVVLVVDGLVNPPGTLGFGGSDYEPFQFGPSPLYGFIELDVDNHDDSGGELMPIARNRYLANAARFGGRPEDSYGEKAITQPGQLDEAFFTTPLFERSGAEFTLAFCGCWPVTIVSQDGDGDGVFDAGETWIVRGRFFERVQAFQEASAVYGGSDFGLYDPWCDVRFRHDPELDRTTITYVGALDMQGAAMLACEPEQPWDYDVSNHTSVREALEDVAEGAKSGPWSAPVEVLIDRWKDEDPEDNLDPTDWYFNALLATAYSTAQGDAPSPFVWTDVAFECETGDFNGDGVVTSLDEGLFCDAVDGSQAVDGFPVEFSMFDLTYDGVLDSQDVACCAADFNGDGNLNILDFVAFQGAFQSMDPSADINGDGLFNILDFVAFQAVFVAGC